MALTSRPIFRSAAFLALVAAFAIILYESSQVHGKPGVLDLTTNQAYAGHFAIYAAMASCAMAAFGRPTLVGVALVLVLSIGLGVAMELYQVHVPTRTASAYDAMADAAGALVGLTIYATAIALLEPPKQTDRPGHS